MLTIDEVIASCEKSAERYRKAFLHCKAHGGEFYNEEAESNKICYEHDRQLAAWLRELQERRKEPEIITCGECEHFRQEPDGEMWCGVSKGHGIDKDFFCGDAERRTE